MRFSYILLIVTRVFNEGKIIFSGEKFVNIILTSDFALETTNTVKIFSAIWQ